MNNITTEEAKHISKLAGLELSDSEIEKFGGQLTRILDYIDKISSADTNNILPLNQTTGSKNVFREDAVKESLTQKEALSNTASSYMRHFKVKQVLKK